MSLNDQELASANELIHLALEEDLGETGDLTSTLLFPESAIGEVQIRAREVGILAGIPLVEMIFQTLSPDVMIVTHVQDGSQLERSQVIATIRGPLGALLSGERTTLNFLSHLSGIATSTGRYAKACEGTTARIYDTRKTLPGYRLLHKYAVRCGGGWNHRMGLFDAVMIKDNHLAGWLQSGESLSKIVSSVRHQLQEEVLLIIEVDSLEQFEIVLPERPDVILLDNFHTEDLRTAVVLKNERFPDVQLEASGGITLETVTEIAATGVDRISIGALTHSVTALDLGFDWLSEDA